jgi:hypothetical protein
MPSIPNPASAAIILQIFISLQVLISIHPTLINAIQLSKFRWPHELACAASKPNGAAGRTAGNPRAVI